MKKFYCYYFIVGFIQVFRLIYLNIINLFVGKRYGSIRSEMLYIFCYNLQDYDHKYRDNNINNVLLRYFYNVMRNIDNAFKNKLYKSSKSKL